MEIDKRMFIDIKLKKLKETGGKKIKIFTENGKIEPTYYISTWMPEIKNGLEIRFCYLSATTKTRNYSGPDGNV